MHSPATKKFVTFVGDCNQPHPSFQQAFEAGIITSWVGNAQELIADLALTPFTNLIVFHAKYHSDLQCAICRQLVARGHRIVCIGCTAEECSPLFIPETDLLSAILVAVSVQSRLNAAADSWMRDSQFAAAPAPAPDDRTGCP